MYRHINRLALIFVLGTLLLLANTPVYAANFELIQPSGTINRGDTIKFEVQVNTQGESIKNIQVGVSYRTQELQYVGVEAGNTFTTVTGTDQPGTGVIINASHPTGYSGSGVFAYVSFKLIATSPGSTQLCSLFTPPSPTVTQPPSASPTPTALPRTGGSSTYVPAIMIGLALVATSGYVLMKRN